jgi:hypothetical protein
MHHPVIFKILGRQVGSSLAGLMAVFRIRHQTPKTMPMLKVRKPRPASPGRRRRSSTRSNQRRNNISLAQTTRKAKMKTPRPTPKPSQTPDMPAAAVAPFDTCPSCGLQAPGSLLTEHFLGSPSHRNGLPKIVEADPVEAEAAAEAEEEDSKQSVRNLLQMLVPPRAFGRRHAHRSIGLISPILENLGPSPGRTRRL